jgi:hypothetical protein
MTDLEKLFITEQDLRRELDAAMGFALSYIENGRQTSFMPHLFVMTKDRPEAAIKVTCCALAVPFDEDDEKRKLLMGLVVKFYQEKTFPVGAVIVSEAWWSHQRPHAPHIEPRHDPARQEVLMAMALDLSLDICMASHLPVRRWRDWLKPDGVWTVIKAGFKSPLLEYFFKGFLLAAEAADVSPTVGTRPGEQN